MISNIGIALDKSHRRALLEGEAAGMFKGKLEGKLESQLAIACKLLLRGCTPAEVMDLTELTAAQVDELIQQRQ